MQLVDRSHYLPTSSFRSHHQQLIAMKASPATASSMAKCSMCNTSSSNETSTTSGVTYADIEKNHLLPSHSQSQPPYYLCTITCCESAGCVKASAAAALDLIVATASAPSYHQHKSQQQFTRSIICRTSPSNCPICIKLRQAVTSGQTPPPLQPEVSVYTAPVPSMRDIAHRVGQLSRSTPNSPLPSITNTSTLPRHQSLSARASPLIQQQQLKKATPTGATPTPISSELSSDSPPIINKNNLTPTYTDYTNEARSTTPGCSSNGGTQQLYNFERTNTGTDGGHKEAIVYGSDYQFYYEGAESHGFFRKAVPALPIPIAVLFCIFNLLLPGSGESLKSFVVVWTPFRAVSLFCL